MISRDEIDSVANEQDVSPADVERDYVFGWLLVGLFNDSNFANNLTLKGGNALRKGYFPSTRFSSDLDFSTPSALNPDNFLAELNKVCKLVQASTKVEFETDRNRLVGLQQIRRDKIEYKYRLYFHDFYGEKSDIIISIRVGATEFDRLLLPVQGRNLIHPYSDANACAGQIRVVKLEEALADKLKCLLQRRMSYDLYDLVHATFISRDIDIDRRELLSTFLRKTIFQRSPGAAKNLLLGVPFDLMRRFWDSKISCPATSRLPFDDALTSFKTLLDDLFAGIPTGRGLYPIFFPAKSRNLIMEAGQRQVLLQLTYHGVTRLVEPYSLTFKRRQDGLGQEYFYAYDCTGGRSSGPGIKTFVNTDVEHLALTNISFTPRFEIEVAKAGELHGRVSFGGNGRSRRSSSWSSSGQSTAKYRVRCAYCNKTFSRKRPGTQLNQHKDPYGNRCPGRRGYQT